MFEGLFEASYFGNSIFQLILFSASVVIAAVVGKAVYYVLKSKVKKKFEQSKSKLDDVVLNTIEKPLVFFLVAVGVGIGLQFVTVPEEHALTVSRVFSIFVAIVGAWVGINLVDAVIKFYVVPLTERTESKLDDQLVPVVGRVIKILVLVFAMMAVLSVGFDDITAAWAGLGIGALAIAFAAQDTIAEVFGGVNIFVSKPFVIGDFVDFEGVVGTVENVSLRQTVIRNLDKRAVIIPNSKISKGVIVNISSEPVKKILMNLGVTYETSVKQIEKGIELIKEIVNKHPGCEDDPIVQFSEFKDFSLNLLVIYYISDKGNWFPIRHEINMAIKEAFDKNKIDFAYPTQLVYVSKQ